MEQLIIALLSLGFTAGLMLMIYLDRRNGARFDLMENRFEKVDQQFREFRTEVDEKFAESARQTNGRIDRLADRLEGRIDKLDARIDKLDGRVDRLADRLDGRIDKLTDAVISLAKSVGREEALREEALAAAE